MEFIRQTLLDLLAEEHPMTVRQIFYQAASVKQIVEKTENQYKAIDRLLVQMRKAGRLPYDWIADNTRWMRKPQTFGSMQHALQYTVQTYRRQLWADQPAYVEIWMEKDALAGVLMEETAPWDVPLMVSRGFSSVSYLYEAAEAIKARGKPAYLYYFGDYDPSGVHITRVVERELREMAPTAEIYFERVTVTPGQIAEWNLPTRPTKKSDSRSKNFLGDSVEVDAIPPRVLRGLVSDCITRHVDERQLAVTRAYEDEEREMLEHIQSQVASWGNHQ